MKITIERTFGIITSEHTDVKDLIKDMSFWQSLPSNCPKCDSKLSLFYRSPKDNDYYGLVCNGQKKHETNFGQYKIKGGFYYKNEWQDAYIPTVQNESRKEILIGEISGLAKLKNVQLTDFAFGVSGETTNNIDNLSIEQLQNGLDMLKRK